MENNPPGDKIKLLIYRAEWLKQQLKLWSDRGLISQEQKQNIESLYEWPPEKAAKESAKKEKHSIRLITVLQVIGALLIGIGVISLVAFNWAKLPNSSKLFIIITAILSAHSAGFFYLTKRTCYQKAGYSLVFLGNLFYGAGIWLIAQMYHIHHSFPTGVFLWALGIIPVLYVIKSQLNYFLALFLFILWTAGETIGFQKPHLHFLLILAGLLWPLAYYLNTKPGLAL